MRLGIVGGGFGLNVHLPVFQSHTDVEVVALADSGSGKVKQSLPSQIKYLDSWQALLEENINIISIATPPATQKEIVLAALSMGKHVFCEKPFGMNLQEAHGMYAASCQYPETVTAVNFQFRYEPGIALMYKQIRSGAVGRMRSMNVSWMTGGRANPHSIWSWRNDLSAGGGVTGAFFSHVADLICWLSDCDPISVYGQEKILVNQRPDSAKQMQPVTAEDMVIAQIELTNGITAACQVTNCQVGGDGMRIEILGELGVLNYHHKPPFTAKDQTLTLRRYDSQDTLELINAYDQVADSRIGTVFDCVAEFLEQIRGNSHVTHPTFEDGVRAHKIMHALKLSAVSGQVQSISEDRVL